MEIHIGRVVDIDDVKRFATIEDTITRAVGIYDFSRIKKAYLRNPWQDPDAEVYKSAILRKEKIGFTIDDGGKVTGLFVYDDASDHEHCSYHEITRNEGRFLDEHHEKLRRVS
jgi:hypothetical protein